jgi:hypothetical protein
MRVFHCRNDACVLPLLAERRRRPWPPVRFYWCVYCVELYAVVGETADEGRHAGLFTYDLKAGCFTLARPGQRARDTELACSLASEVALPPTAVRRYVGPEE